MNSKTLNAYAKINPTLEITGKKENGFFSLAISWHKISLFDTISVNLNNKAKGVFITSDNPSVPQKKHSEKNNCYKAVKKLERFIQKKDPSFVMPGVEIHIWKKLPLSGGLGGSATNASATLEALISLLKIPISFHEKNLLASQVGHDCSFFCSGFAHALGEEISSQGVPMRPLPALEGHMIFVSPKIEIFSGNAYAGMHSVFQKIKKKYPSKKIESSFFSKTSLQEKTKYFCNHLELSQNTFLSYPLLKEIKKDLLSEGCLTALMSGSGSTLFGVVEQKTRAEKIENTLKKKYISCHIFTAEFLS